ncbi:MAG: response regulator [Bacteroidia bacterium]
MKNKTILLIEDDYLDVESVKRSLKKLGVNHTLYVAHNGVDGLAILTGNSTGAKVIPDVILLDINMPKMNGLELLRIIKSYYSLNHIKIFIVTTSSEEHDKIASQSAGVDGYIIKPLDFANSKSGDSLNQLKELLIS